MEKWGAKHEDIGTYVGILVSSFFFAQLLTVAAWGRAADAWGRRPILLVGLLGTALSQTVFGVAKSFEVALAARFLTGMLNGNVAIAKVYMGEITDASTQATGFGWLAFTWGLGTVIAPALGGWLADPAAQHPDTAFARIQLFVDYPYILPALVSVGFSIASFLLGVVFLPETAAWRASKAATARERERNVRKQAKPRPSSSAAAASSSSSAVPAEALHIRATREADLDDDDEDGAGAGGAGGTAIGGGNDDDADDDEMAGLVSATPSKQRAGEMQRRTATAKGGAGASKPLPPLLPHDASFRDILRDRAVLIAVANYGVLAFCQILFDELLPVFAKTAKGDGGLGWTSGDVGSLQVVQGAVQIVVNLFILPRLVAAFGLFLCFRNSVAPLIPILLVFPAAGRLSDRPDALWPVMALGVAFKAGCMAPAFTSIMLLINNSSRGRALGSINGFAQSVASLVRAIGPTLGGALFDASIGPKFDFLGSYRLHAVYAIMSILAAITFALSFALPEWCNEAPALVLDMEGGLPPPPRPPPSTSTATSTTARTTVAEVGTDGVFADSDDDEVLYRDVAKVKKGLGKSVVVVVSAAGSGENDEGGGTDDELDAAAGIGAGRPGGGTAQGGKGKGTSKGKSSSRGAAATEGGLELPPVGKARRPS